MNHRNRSVCFLLLFLALGAHLLERSLGGLGLAWAGLVLQFLIGPQLQYLWARRSHQPIQAEFINMLIDSVGFGLWTAMLGFPLALTLLLPIGASFNLTAFRGVRGLGEAVLATGAGVLLGLLLQDPTWMPQASALATGLSVLVLHVFVALVALSAHDRSVRLQLARQQLRTSEQALQQQLEQNQRLHAQLEDQAHRDPLTGLFNRRYLVETMDRALAQSVQQGQPLSLLLLDLDHFKQVNDTWGHQTGDEVLRAVAARLVAQVRTGDTVCRYGGEEFLVLLPGMPHAQAEERARHCCAELGQQPIPAGDLQLAMTWSIGVASHPLHGDSAQAIIAAADRALYAAKHQGRNRVAMMPAHA
ncbi:diguanylate cyclase [Sphaerotilus sp.]|uniref:sensor domain-containing diguanylate cyclase n=1 Tax=Sphaerotilus sp. TaxID=2093942 RepID=UPI002ACD4871|nr:diguanylate cyclase [Sphaerotilus sp.]MDZ7855553.1 diguanylate cyclase [Sphaerotilus sp.]